MFSIAKRITSGVVAGAVVLGILAVYPTGNKGKVYAASLGDTGYTTNDGYNATYDTVGSVNYNTVLGRATAYGIVADTWEQNNHAETNFAVNKFVHNTTTSGHVLEPDLAGTAPLSFLVGDIEGKLIFGGATYEQQNVKYVIHTTQALKDDYDSHQNVDGNSEAYKDAKIAVQDIAGKAALSVDSLYSSDSVSNMIAHVRTESDNLATKTSTVDIALYESAHPQDSNQYVLDLDVDDYDGKVVYITVPYNSTLGSIFKDSTSHSQALYVRKKANTNVVFNFTDAEWTTVCAKGPLVHVTDKAVEYNKAETLDLNNELYIIPKTQYDHNDQNKIVEEEIVDRVIFNFPNSTTVNVLEGGGAYLAPRATTSEVISTSSGWFVTGGTFVNNTCEWHFLNGDRASSLFFSGQKKFTESYTNHRTESPEVELYDYSGITYNDGDFKFDLFHSDSNYNLGSIIETVPVSAAGEFSFKPLEGLVPGQTYYYVIKETADTIAGITNSDGEIDIQVDVYDKGQGEVGYRITSRKYLTAADKANGISFRSNDAKEAQELDFYFGSVYNLVTPDTGSLTVTKVLSDEKPTTAPIEYTFYVKCGNEGYVQDATTGAVSTNKHAFTVTAGDTNGTVITGLKLDKTYTVEEADVTGLPAGWSCAATYSKNSVNLTSSHKEDSVQITNTFSYTAPANDAFINITKTFGGDVTAADYASLTFEIYDGDGNKIGDAIEFNTTNFNKVSTGNYQLKNTIKVEAGKSYYVVESSTAISGYELVSVSYKLDGETNPTVIDTAIYQSGATSVLTAGDTSTVTFTNTYNKITGKLTVDKELSGVTGNATKEYKFVVIVGNNEGYLQTNGKLGDDRCEFTVQPGFDKSINVDYSVFGKKLTVEEVTTATVVDIDGYNFVSVGYSDNNGVTFSDTSRTATVVVTNTYQPNTTTTKAYVDITKSFGGGVTKDDLDGKLTFKLYEEGNSTAVATYTFGTAEFEETSSGSNVYHLKTPFETTAGKTYYVVEESKAITGYDLVKVEYSLDGGTTKTDVTTTKTTGNGTTVDTKTTTFGFVNTYQSNSTTPAPAPGALTINKVVSGTSLANSKTYTFTVTGPSYPSGTTVDISGGGTTTLDNLEPGDYTVVEDTSTADISGYTLKVSGDNNSAITVEAGKTATCNITNTYTDESAASTNTIVITKSFAGISQAQVSQLGLNNITFTVTGVNTGYSRTINYSDLTDGSYTWDNLDPDTYTVTEDGATAAATSTLVYDSTDVSITLNGADVTTIDLTGTSDKANVVFVNNYQDTSAPAPTTGSLTIYKNFSGDVPSGAASNVFAFTVTGPSYPSGTTVYVTGNGSDTLGNLIPGDYTVSEDRGSANFIDYSLSVSGETTVTVSAGDTAECTITNSYTSNSVTPPGPGPNPNPTSGYITFKKTFGGDVTESEAKGCGLYFIISNGSEYLKADGSFTTNVDEAHITLADLNHVDGTMEWGKEYPVPLGTYSVTEHNDRIYVGGSRVPYTLEQTSVTTATVTITGTSTTGDLNLTNEYTNDGFDVEISKEDIAGKEIAQAQLTLRSLDGLDLSLVIVTQNGVKVTTKLSENNTAISFVTVDTTYSVVKGLKPGRYELEETVTPEAYLTADKIVFELKSDGSVADSAGNVVVAGSPIVMIDKADPTYQTSVISANRSPIPSTGEGISYYTCAGVLILGMCTAGFVGFGVYRKKKKEF